MNFLYVGVKRFGILDSELIPLRMVDHVLDESEFGAGSGFVRFEVSFGPELFFEVSYKIVFLLGIELKSGLL